MSSSEANGINGGGDQAPVVERAVILKVLNVTKKGTMVQCDLNPSLGDLGKNIPVFIEFEGVEIERKEFKNANGKVPFTHFNPETDGLMVCVVEFAGSEFESEPVFIEAQ